jgi:hypothetical protein
MEPDGLYERFLSIFLTHKAHKARAPNAKCYIILHNVFSLTS